MVRSDNLKRLLDPRHVAFVGGRVAVGAARRCEAMGFAGDIWIVSPKHARLAGWPTFARIEDLPEAPDAAFLAVPREATVAVVRALAAAHAGGCVCYAAGFSEAGAEGKALEGKLVEAAGDMALVGPNCYGVINALVGLSLFPPPHGAERIEAGVAIISQSGNISLNVTMSDRSVPIACVISAGNQAVLGFDDYISALAPDPRIQAIGLYIEGLRDIAGFSNAAAAAIDAGVPIVAVKAGSSEAGARMTLSHTRSLAGAEEFYRALFDRLAIIRADSVPAMLETLKLMAVSTPLDGRRLGVLTASGGDGALLADRAAKAGLDLPPPTANQAEALGRDLVAYANPANPLDYNNPLWGDASGLERCFATMMGGDFDATALILDYPRPGSEGIEEWDTAVDALIAARRKTGKWAVVVSTLPELMPGRARRRLMAAGIAPLQGLEEAVSAIAGAAWFAERRRTIAATERGTGALPLPAAGELPAASVLDEWASKRELAAFGVRLPEARLASAAEAPDAAASLGFPVAVKAVSAALVHKTDVGAVALNQKTAEAVEAAVARIGAAVAGVPEAGECFIIERMIEGAVAELIVGVRREPPFGLALIVGSGGELVDVVEDSQAILLPADRGAIADALDSLRAARLMDGFRGRPAGDREAAIDAIVAIAAFAEHHRDRLVELDVNPLPVLAKGQGAFAVDAMIRMAVD